MRLTFRSSAGMHEAVIQTRTSAEGTVFDVTVDGAAAPISVTGDASGLFLLTPGGRVPVIVSRDGTRRFVSATGLGDVVLERTTGSSPRRTDHHAGDLASPMPGKVVAVRVAAGDAVEKGQVLVIVEAMKMEMPIVAPHAGRVIAVHAAPGALCDAGIPLVEVGE